MCGQVISEYTELRRSHLRLCGDLVHAYRERAQIWCQPTETGVEDGMKPPIKTAEQRVSELKTELRTLCGQAKGLGKRFRLEQMVETYGLSEVERDILIVLLIQDSGIFGSARDTSLTGAELLGLLFQDDFEILEARRLLYADAPLRHNCLIVIDDYADSVLQSTFRVPEEKIRLLLEHDAKEVQHDFETIILDEVFDQRRGSCCSQS